MKTVYFVRHGESQGNVSDTFFGDSSKLTERGRQQAQFIAKRAMKLPIETIIASTMPRALETAELISKEVGKSVEQSDLFRERRWPTSVIGKKKSDAEASEIVRRWFASFYGGKRVEDGENFDDVKKRAQEALSYLESCTDKEILVATHGFFERMLLAIVLFGDSLTPQEFFKIALTVRTANTGISIFEYHEEKDERFDNYSYNGWRVRVWNDHAHFG